MQHAEVSYAVRVNCSFTFNVSAVAPVDTFASLDDFVYIITNFLVDNVSGFLRED